MFQQIFVGHLVVEVRQIDKSPLSPIIIMHCIIYMRTVIPEIFARVLFSLIFAVGVGPRKVSA